MNNDIDNDLTNLSLVSASFPPSLPSQDELEKSQSQDRKIAELEEKIIDQGEHSKRVFERKINIRGIETKMKNQIQMNLDVKTH